MTMGQKAAFGRWAGAVVARGGVLAACATTSGAPPAPTVVSSPTTRSTGPTEPTETPVPSATPTLNPDEPPPAGAQSTFKTDFSQHPGPYGSILSGGPPKDGIPAIEEPKFVRVAEADTWL